MALAAEAEGDLPRAEGDATAGLPLARRLHLAHLALLVIAGAAAATSVAFMFSPVGEDSLIVAIAEKDANLGMIRLKLKKEVQALATAASA